MRSYDSSAQLRTRHPLATYRSPALSMSEVRADDEAETTRSDGYIGEAIR